MSPLFKKLNLSNQDRILVLNSPDSFEEELSNLDGVQVLRKGTSKLRVAFAMAFAVTQKELDSLSKKLVQAADGDAVLWVAFPKGTSKKYRCEFNRDSGWTILGEAGFETVRIVAIDEDWSALRFRRTEHVKSMTRKESMAISEQGKRKTLRP